MRRSTITIWIGKARSGHGTQEAKRGRSVGEFRVLTAAQEDRIRQGIVDKTPDQMKLSFALWSAQAVKAYIKQCCAFSSICRSGRCAAICSAGDSRRKDP